MAAPVAQMVAPSHCCPGRDVEEGAARAWDGAWPVHQPEAVWLLMGAASPRGDRYHLSETPRASYGGVKLCLELMKSKIRWGRS